MKGYQQKESTLNKKAVNEINKIHGCCVRKRPSGPWRKGHSDITGGVRINDVCILIELEGKIGTNKPTRLQARWIAKWKAMGAITGVYRSVEDAIKIVTDGIKQKRNKIT